MCHMLKQIATSVTVLEEEYSDGAILSDRVYQWIISIVKNTKIDLSLFVAKTNYKTLSMRVEVNNDFLSVSR